MGCCASRPANAQANSDGALGTTAAPTPTYLDRNNASSRNLNAPSSRRASVPSSRGSVLNVGPSPAAAQPNANAHVNNRPNNLLAPIPADQRSTLPNTLASPTTAKSRNRVRPLTDPASQAWTRSRLDKERRDWWDTRVTGSQEVWGTLRFVTDYLQQGDIENAQALFDAQGCTCPDGQLWRGVYDDSGVLYKIPEWLVIEPAGLVEEEEEEPPAGTRTDAAGAGSLVPDLEVDDTEFMVRARISNTGADIRIRVRRNETIASICGKLKPPAQLYPETKLRLVYGGRIYQDDEILETNAFWKYENDYILSAYVVSRIDTTT